MLRVKSPQDFWSGILVIAFGCAGLWFGRDYVIGTAARMGPGYLPLVLSLALVALGAVILARSLVLDGAPIERSAIRPQLLILAAIVLFGLLIERAGLAVSVAAVTIVSGLATREVRWIELGVLAIALAAACGVRFVYLLGQPIPVWSR